MAQDDIQGQVVDPSGNPVSGAIVELTRSYESNPVEEQTVLRTTTDSNGNYIFEAHPDGDGTTQDYHVSCYNYDGTAYVNSNDNPGVSAALPSNAIPDSVVYQYNSLELSGFADGDTVLTWPPNVGSTDATGEGTYRSGGINSVASVEFDGSNDGYTAATGSLTQPFTIIVVQNNDNGSNEADLMGDDGDNVFIRWQNSEWGFQAGGSRINGTQDDTAQLITVHYDGANSFIREDGTETGSGDPGSNDQSDLVIGFRGTANDLHWNGDVGLLEAHDGLPTNGVSDREQQIADDFNITL